MPSVLDELVALLSLERLEENLYRGQSQDLGWGVVFGGQVLGQALTAAMRTAPEDRSVHSLHAYFLRPGDVKAPIVYDVDRIRDGTSFTTRRVVAIQHGEAIFNLAASFQRPEAGFSHQDERPKVPPPEALPTDQERFARHGAALPAAVKAWALAERPIESRTVEDDDPFNPVAGPPDRSVWFKARHRLPDAPGLHQALLAYASDSAFLTTAMKPHAATWWTRGMQVASLDHAVWFHRPFRVDEWLLHVMHSPSAAASRGLVFGKVYTRDGQLVATTAQEGLTRKRD
ncbi:MAG: acyl-CoA thioesterase II [Myxococcaceae bacterium]|jgi:acyl-CoA thioesterase-2|nr:acyl-CoA thioesterase II [Myxococcaceae bacterium]MCA3011073.1 acyl-CoA thioesterase II [Myxococcaceae bacterium]